jgi:carbamoyl-phosphate synthase large subunit
VKVPVFSSAKLTDMDIALGPEMKSTGEVLGIDADLKKALYKGFVAAGTAIPTEGNIFATIRQAELTPYTAQILQDYIDAGFKLYVSSDNLDFASQYGINVNVMTYDTAIKWIGNHDAGSDMRIDLVLNVPEMANSKENDSFPVRRKSVERGIPTLTCMDTAKAFLDVIKLKQAGEQLQYAALE